MVTATGGAAALVPAAVGDTAPVRLGRELDRLAVALGLHVAEGAGQVVEHDVELALLDALVQPGGAEDEPAQPVHQRAVRGPDELRPAVVDVLAERARGIGHLAVDGEVDEVLELGLAQAALHEAELAPGLLDALGEVALVEGEAKLTIFQDVVLTRVVVAAANLVHCGEPGVAGASACYARILL